MQRLSLSATLELVDVAQQNPKQAAFALCNTLNIHVGGPEAAEQNMRMYKFSLVLLHKFGLVQHAGARLRPTLAGSAAARLTFYDPVNVFMVALAPTEIFATLLRSPEALLSWLALPFTFQEPKTEGGVPSVKLPKELIGLVNHMNAEIVWEAAQMLQQSRMASAAGRAIAPVNKFQPLPFSTVKGCSIKALSLAQRFEPQVDEAELTRTISLLSGPEQQPGPDDIFRISTEEMDTLLHREFGKGWGSLPLLHDESPKSTAALLFFFTHTRESESNDAVNSDNDDSDNFSQWLFRETLEKFDYPGSELTLSSRTFANLSKEYAHSSWP